MSSAATDASAGRRRRRRSGRRLITSLVVLVVLAVAVITADVLARRQVQSVIGDRLATSLGLSGEQPADVRVGGFSVLLQLARGRLDRVDVDADAVTIGGLSGSADVRALGVPTDGEAPVDDLAVRFRIDESQLEKLSANLSELPIESVRIDGDVIRVAVRFEVFGIPIPLGVGITPEASDGQLAFTPQSISVNDATVSAEELRQLFGQPARAALSTRDFCIAGSLPRALRLTGAAIRDDDLELGFSAENMALSESALATKGACPAG